jgi:hypothetical protein
LRIHGNAAHSFFFIDEKDMTHRKGREMIKALTARRGKVVIFRSEFGERKIDFGS